MNAARLAFSSSEMLRMLEGLGLTGTWSWCFGSGNQTWSLGLHRILGLEPGSVRPSYALFLSLVHPEDRAEIETVADVSREGLLRDHRVRAIRPDGSIRLLSTRGEIYISPTGRPLGAAGTVLDVTEEDRLARAQAAERRRRWAVFEQTRCFQFSRAVEGVFQYPAELLALTGFTQEELVDDGYMRVVPEEREHWRSVGFENWTAGTAYSMTPLVPFADGRRERLMAVMVPVRNAQGKIVEWSNFTRPASGTGAPIWDGALLGLEQAVRGHHLRAARALLCWTMQDLALASGLSYTTTRRLEEDAEAPSAASRHRVIAALRASGIHFTLTNCNQIAVFRR
ncbi:PAS domain-containing protein [Methylobacterium oxalidis]|uniref:PAS domain-containing protein n=1 Tax=Methylobacterium oxalidis TaxID=944322 RepID=UPI001478EB69|nr:PAS domain-containing protein [Methylobacterium oxalidis]